jgi:hypothetical protein
MGQFREQYVICYTAQVPVRWTATCLPFRGLLHTSVSYSGRSVARYGWHEKFEQLGLMVVVPADMGTKGMRSTSMIHRRILSNIVVSRCSDGCKTATSRDLSQDLRAWFIKPVPRIFIMEGKRSQIHPRHETYKPCEWHRQLYQRQTWT